MTNTTPIRVSVLGASGYTGGELVRLLAAHPDVDLAYLGVRDAGDRSLAGEHPFLASLDIPLQDLDGEAAAKVSDVVFMAMPHGLSSDVVPAVLEVGSKVIDLGADFRIQAEDYPEWYGMTHPAPSLLDDAVYGLPELFAEQIVDSQLVANPGCYPTSVILGLSPLIAAGLIGSPVMVDGKSGLSGAGKQLNEASMFSTTFESVRPYKLPRHQHTPEMEQGIERATGIRPGITFAPHLVPTVRGIVCTCFAPLKDSGTSTEQLTACLQEAYDGAPFVEVLPAGGMVDSKRVRGANTVELQAVADPRTGTAVVIGAIDNLVKGAAGQAIQNMNLMLGLSETAGLSTIGVYP